MIVEFRLTSHSFTCCWKRSCTMLAAVSPQSRGIPTDGLLAALVSSTRTERRFERVEQCSACETSPEIAESLDKLGSNESE